MDELHRALSRVSTPTSEHQFNDAAWLKSTNRRDQEYLQIRCGRVLGVYLELSLDEAITKGTPVFPKRTVSFGWESETARAGKRKTVGVCPMTKLKPVSENAVLRPLTFVVL
jgi:hypothetical protein